VLITRLARLTDLDSVVSSRHKKRPRRETPRPTLDSGLKCKRPGKDVKVKHSIPVSVKVLSPKPQPVQHTVSLLLKPTAKLIHDVLIRLATDLIETRGQSIHASQVVFHLSGELLALHLGIGRATLYRHLPALREAGLVAYKGHTSTHKGLGRKDGTLFAVSLREGYMALLRREDYKHSWRDLTADIASGVRTAWHLVKGVRQSKNPRGSDVEYSQLLQWAVKPGTTDKPVIHDCLKANGDTLEEYVYTLDLLSEAHPAKRGEIVDRYARVLSRAYRDSDNLNFWRWLIWRVLEADSQGLGSLYQLQNALTRLKTDLDEWQGLKRPGALLVARLRQVGIWDSLTSS
jgi:DNA-binding transcriptional ArsR family regulator